MTESDSAFVADICVVGAGAAGIVLTRELSRRGRTVTLLEAGAGSLDHSSQEPYQSELSGLHHRGIHSGRFRAYGGTTTKWGGQILELDEEDFDRRPWIAGSGWPFPKSTLAKYYEQALEAEGLNTSIPTDDDVWKLLGSPQPSFNDLGAYLSRWCPEPNFARRHGKSLAEASTIQVWLHANAVGLTYTDERVDGVRVRSQNGREAKFRAKEFVFCLGAIESSRFFLQALDGRLPWNSSGMLGRHFQDHIDCNAATVLPLSLRELHRLFDSIFIGGYKYQPKINLPFPTQVSQRTLNAGATLAFQSDEGEALTSVKSTAKHLLHGRFGEITTNDLASVCRNLPAALCQSYRYAMHHRSYQPNSAAISLRVHCEQEPCSASTISLSDERDSFGMRRSNLNWSISKIELHTIRTIVDATKHALSAVAEIVPHPMLDDDEELRTLCEDSFHHMGGMRMDDSASCGVVDSNLKLHGTKNTWICSSAVFPTSGFSNPTHTLLALTLRLAENLCG